MIARSAGIACLVTFLVTGSAGAEPVIATAQPVAHFKGAEIGSRVDGLVWRGGLVLDSQNDTFGGISGLGFTSPDNHLVMVSDRGNFISGQLLYDEAGRPAELVGLSIAAIPNSKGNDLPRAFARDAESMAVIERDGRAATVRVGFENLTRVADFSLLDNRPDGAAREVPIPDWVSKVRTNEALESVCIAPPASPIAGSTLLLLENSPDAEGNHRGYLLGHNDKGPIGLVPEPGLRPSDCAFLPDGDLLVLERGVSLFTFAMKLIRVPADEVRPETVMQGKVLLQAFGGDVDNMEGVATHVGPDGTTRITLVSDNNFNDWERTLLLEFSLPEGDPAARPFAMPPSPAN